MILNYKQKLKKAEWLKDKDVRKKQPKQLEQNDRLHVKRKKADEQLHQNDELVKRENQEIAIKIT